MLRWEKHFLKFVVLDGEDGQIIFKVDNVLLLQAEKTHFSPATTGNPAAQ